MPTLDILARTISQSLPRGLDGHPWQYHSRSDHHSKVACWCIVFDLLSRCPLLRDHVATGKVAFGINHRMVDFRNNRKKDLDLVLCTPRDGSEKRPFDLAGLAVDQNIVLDDRDIAQLKELPRLVQRPVGSVLVALEAKACMTAHQKALPRLYDELNSSHLTVHGAASEALAAAFVMVNAAPTFVSPGRNAPGAAERVVTRHNQPRDADLVVRKMMDLPRRSGSAETGYDALAIAVVDCRNDGTAVNLVHAPPAPPIGDIFHYQTLVDRMATLYASRFARL